MQLTKYFGTANASTITLFLSSSLQKENMYIVVCAGDMNKLMSNFPQLAL